MKKNRTDGQYLVQIFGAWAAALAASGVILTIFEIGAAWSKIEGPDKFQALANVIGGGLGGLGAYLVFWSERKHERAKAEQELSTLRHAALRDFKRQMPGMLRHIDTELTDFNVSDPGKSVENLYAMFVLKILECPKISESTRHEFARRLDRECSEYEDLDRWFAGFKEAVESIAANPMGSLTSGPAHFSPADRLIFYSQCIAGSVRRIMLKFEDSNFDASIEGCDSITQRCRTLEGMFAFERSARIRRNPVPATSPNAPA